MKRSDNNSKNVTMADIASSLGVSIVTVSNALAGKKGVSAEVRAAVFLKARELGYIEGVSEGAEREAVSAKTGDIGIIATQRYLSGENGFHWQLYQELVTQLKQDDRYAILDVVSEEDESKLKMPRIIENHLVCGVIMLGQPDLKFLNEINKRKLPIVFLDFSIRDFDFTSIAGDDYYDMYRIACFVISHGHSNICYVAENPEEIKRDRYLGYCRAVAESEIDPAAPRNIEDALECFDNEKITAYLCESLPIAEVLMKKLREKSIIVPDMVSVACTAEFKINEKREITCVCRDPSQMARFAVDALRSKLSGEGKGIVGRIAVGGKLVAGRTTRSHII